MKKQILLFILKISDACVRVIKKMFLHKNASAQKRSGYRLSAWRFFGECPFRLRLGSHNLGSFLLLAIFGIGPMSAQIDMSDSTVQVISYWKLGDVQDYHLTESEIVMTNKDTISIIENAFDVEIKVTDSTSVGYILEWTRKNFQFSSSNSLDVQLQAILSDTPVLLTTDIYGSNVQVLNWETLSNAVNDKCSLMLIEYEDNLAGLTKINQTKRKYVSKESIETFVIRDVSQFFAYHGAKYQLGETITEDIKMPNNYGGDPLDATAAMVLDELLPENNTSIIKSFLNINARQLTAVTYDYLKSLNIVEGSLPSYEDFPTVTKQIWGGSEIHSNSGWVIYSQESEQVTSGDDVTLKERIIEIVN